MGEESREFSVLTTRETSFRSRTGRKVDCVAKVPLVANGERNFFLVQDQARNRSCPEGIFIPHQRDES